MHPASTPLTAFHSAIRVLINAEDHEVPTAYDINERIKLVLNKGHVPGYKISADGSGVEPALTPEANQKAFTLLVDRTALAFPRLLTTEQKDELQMEIDKLER